MDSGQSDSYSRAEIVVHTRKRHELDEILDTLLADGLYGATFEVRVDELAVGDAPEKVRSFFEKVVV